MKKNLFVSVILATSLLLSTAEPSKADDDAELAKKLANPIASLISAPFQYNYSAGACAR